MLLRTIKIGCVLRWPAFRTFCSTVEHSPLGTGPVQSLKNGTKHTRSLLQVYPEVGDAVASNKPVVALESTIITHGMPYPQNLSVAKEVIKIVRDNGAVPATVAVINGSVHVGISDKDLEGLAHPGNHVIKTSRRDLPYMLSQGLSGGTTVSATMIAANKAGINVFVTGGIGGVHRQAEKTFDISADLTELGRTPVAVVCAGAKSILDIGLTLEYLETQGVPVATYGSTNDFPAFFTAKSGFKSSCSVKTPEEAAKLIDCSASFGLQNGIVIAVPIPDTHAALGSEIEQAIQQALQDASASDIIGKELTPFVLQRVNELTKGRSLEANISLIRNNATIGSQIAVELSRIKQRKMKTPPLKQHSREVKSTLEETSKKDDNQSLPGRPVVVGGSNVDFVATATSIIAEASNPGKVRMSFGGVGRNIAEGLSRLGKKPLFISAVGGDALGAMLLKHCQEANMGTGGIHTFSTCQTATYSAILSNSGDFNMAVGDMDVHLNITPHIISGYEESMQNAPVMIFDNNFSKETIEAVIEIGSQHGVPVWFEPTCMLNAGSLFQTTSWQKITYASPNMNELKTMSDTVVQYHNVPRHPRVDKWTKRETSLDDLIDDCVLLAQPLMTHIHCLVITLGKHGVVVCRNTTADHPFPTAGNTQLPSKHNHLVSAVHFPAPTVTDVINVTGAGDSLAAAMVMSIIKGYKPEVCVKNGLKAAAHSIKSHDTIAQSLTADILDMNSDNVVFDSDWTPRAIDISYL